MLTFCIRFILGFDVLSDMNLITISLYADFRYFGNFAYLWICKGPVCALPENLMTLSSLKDRCGNVYSTSSSEGRQKYTV